MGLGGFKKFFDGLKNIGNKIKVGLFGDGIDDDNPGYSPRTSIPSSNFGKPVIAPGPQYTQPPKTGFINSDFAQNVLKPITGEVLNQGIQHWLNPTPQQPFVPQFKPQQPVYQQPVYQQPTNNPIKPKPNPKIVYNAPPTKNGKKSKNRYDTIVPILQ
jgi:hypothetical protein